MLNKDAIFIKENIKTKEQAIDFIGQYFVENNFCTKEYPISFFKREKLSSVYIGNYLSIVHGVREDEHLILKTGLIIVFIPQGIIWNNEKCHFVFGLCTKSQDHLEILSQIAIAFSDFEKVENLKNNFKIYDLLEIIKN